jgi:asparagine synthase (glutamine-hydrolysing)
LRSDVPVGLCLSGGLDSSSIASILINNYGLNSLQTFSAVYNKSFEFDETEYINEYRCHLNNMNYITPSADTLFLDKEKFVLAQGEPVPSTSPYAQYKVMQLAQGKVKVTLDGQGADEQLAGYHYFYGNYYKELLLTFRLLKLFNEIRLNYKIHNSLYSLKTFLYFMLPETMRTDVRANRYGYLNTDFNSFYKDNNFISGKLYSSGSLNEALLNHFNYKLEHLLKWEDRNSMTFSIEARLPFLDYRIVEYILSLPSSSKIYKGQTKFILRDQMKGILPEKIRNRHSKIGFDTPEDNWFRSDKFVEFVNDIISSDIFNQSNYFNTNAVMNLYNGHISNKKNVSKEIWKWINYYIWYENIIKS